MPTSRQIGKGLAMGVDRKGEPLPPLNRRCPFCGDHPQWKPAQMPSPKYPYAVECVGCSASTTFYKLAQIAAAAWDRRTK